MEAIHNLTVQFTNLYTTTRAQHIAMLKSQLSLSTVDAEEAVELVWTKVWADLTLSDDKQAEVILKPAYIYQSCKQQALSILSKKKNLNEVSLFSPVDDEDFEDMSYQKKALMKLECELSQTDANMQAAKEFKQSRLKVAHRALMTLKESHRKLILGHYYGKKPYAQLAIELGFKNASVAKQTANRDLHRIRQNLLGIEKHNFAA